MHFMVFVPCTPNSLSSVFPLGALRSCFPAAWLPRLPFDGNRGTMEKNAFAELVQDKVRVSSGHAPGAGS